MVVYDKECSTVQADLKVDVGIFGICAIKPLHQLNLVSHCVYTIGLGQYSQYRYSIDTYRYCHHAVLIQMMVTAAKNNEYSGPKTIGFTLDFHTI